MSQATVEWGQRGSSIFNPNSLVTLNQSASEGSGRTHVVSSPLAKVRVTLRGYVLKDKHRQKRQLYFISEGLIIYNYLFLTV